MNIFKKKVDKEVKKEDTPPEPTDTLTMDTTIDKGKTVEEPSKPKKDAPQTFNIKYTREEVEKKIEELKATENVQLFLRVSDGQEKYNEILNLSELLFSK